jgi:hypothetical protein
LSLSKQPITYYFCNIFVLTEQRAYFFPYRREFSFPPVRDILGEIFDLDEPEIYKEVRERLAVGRIVVGDYYPKTEEVIIQVPLEECEYVERRIMEVFGDG